MRAPRLTLRDWVGDGILTVIGGAVIVAAVFLPWANESSRGRVNFALGHPASINGALATDYGPPVLALGVGVIAAGVFMLAFRPTRASLAVGLGVAVLGAAVAAMALHAGGTIWRPMHPGLGLFLEALVGVLLVPVGIASAMVGQLLRSGAAGERAAPTGGQTPTGDPSSLGENDATRGDTNR